MNHKRNMRFLKAKYLDLWGPTYERIWSKVKGKKDNLLILPHIMSPAR